MGSFGGIPIGNGGTFGGVPISASDPEAKARETTGSMVGDALAGTGSGLIHTMLGAYHLIRMVPGVGDKLPEPNAFVRALGTSPDTLSGHVGRYGEQAAEYVIPASEVAKATEGARLIARMAAQGATAGTVRATQGGSAGDVADTAAMGAAGPLIGDAAGAAYNLVKNSAVGSKLATVAPDLVGVISPRWGNILRVANKVIDATAPEAKTATTEDADLLEKLAQSLSGKSFKSLGKDAQDEIRKYAAFPQGVSPARPTSAPAPSPAAAAPVVPQSAVAPEPVIAPAPGPVQTFVPGGPVRPPVAAPVAAPANAAVTPAAAPEVAPPAPEAQPEDFPLHEATAWLRRQGIQNAPETQAPPGFIEKAADWLNKRQGATPKADSKNIAAQLFEELQKGGWRPPVMEPDMPFTPGGQTAVRETMADLPGNARRAVAKATYAGDQDPELAASTFKAANGANKADAMAAELNRQKVTAKFLDDHFTSDDLARSPVIESVRKALGLKSPMSSQSIGQMMQKLKDMEAK